MGNDFVYVLSKEGEPLMPTRRFGKVRWWLKNGEAHVVHRTPFTIQMDRVTTNQTQPVTLGVDSASEHLGASASTETQELLRVEVELRPDVKKNMSTRRELRRGRRYRNTRYRKPRFDNRGRKGFIAPTIEQKVRSHENIIRFVRSILPVESVVIEVAPFDTQKLENPDIEGVAYQNGPLKDFSNEREYVLYRDGHTCQHCKGKSGDKVLQVHHIVSRKVAGNSPRNLITLCKTCHEAYHAKKIRLKLTSDVNLRHAAHISVIPGLVRQRLSEHGVSVRKTYGYITKQRRFIGSLPKSHTNDAFCIAGNLQATRLSYFYYMRCIRRHTRSLHVMKPGKGGKRRSAVAPKRIGKSSIQRYDMVSYRGQVCFVFGSTGGRLVLKDIYGKKVHATASVSTKAVKFLQKKRNGFMMCRISEAI